MRLIKYEINKIIASRTVLRVLITLLIFNALICAYHISKYPKSFYDTVDYVFNLYYESPETLEQQYEEYTSAISFENNILKEQIAAGNYDYTPNYPPNQYGNEQFSDEIIYEEVFSRIKNISNYQTIIQNVIDQSEQNLEKCELLGISKDSFSYRYQQKNISQYHYIMNAANVRVENAKGWDVFFLYDIDNILIFVFIAILSITIYYVESQTDCLNIIRITKGGRFLTAISKGIVLILSTIVVNLLFSIETAIIIGHKIGFSSIDNEIQVFKDFVFCPFKLSILQYGIVSFVFESVSYLTFSTIATLIILLLKNVLLAYVSTIGIYCVNLVFYFLRSLSGNMALNTISIFSVSSADTLLTQHKAINFFYHVIPTPFFTLIIYLIILCLTAFLNIIIYNKLSSQKFHFPFLISQQRNRIHFSIQRRPHKRRTYSLSIFFQEIFKSLIASKKVLILILLIIIKIGTSSLEFQPYKSYSEQVYKDYMIYLEGELTPEKNEFIKNERKIINDTLSLKSQMQSQYINGELSADKYKEYLTQYNYALGRDETFSFIEKHAVYVNALASEGKSAWFVYDSGWKLLFNSSFDWTLYIACILISSSIFSIEYNKRTSSHPFSYIVRSCKKGRYHIFLSKTFFCIFITFILTIIWCGIDLIHVNNSFDLPLLSAPIHSIEEFYSIEFSPSIGQYLVCFIITKLLAVLALALLSSALSCLITKQLFSVMISSVLTLLPEILSIFNIAHFDFINFVLFFKATPILCSTAPFISILLIELSVLFVTTIAGRKWCK